MNNWIDINNAQEILHPSVTFLILTLVIASRFFYKFFLKRISEERHKNLKKHYRSLLNYFFIGAIIYSLSWLALTHPNSHPLYNLIKPYIYIVTIIFGMIIIVKWARLSVLQYLFLTSINAGVPLLLVNIISLALSVLLAIWFANSILGVHLMPLIATSAVLSIILGLALQDTLGNLFAGIAMQVEKPYSIGDWIEVQLSNQKIMGRVDEISWRATILVGWTDEQITIPNRLISQVQIANFSIRQSPFYKSVIFRLNYTSDLQQAKAVLLKVPDTIAEVEKLPKPMALVTDTNESWIAIKLIYCIKNYSKQLIIADEIFTAGLQALALAGFKPARQIIEIENT